MTEPRYCDLLAAYEMGLLEADESAAFEAHLPGCPDCLEEMYELAPAVLEMRANPGPYAAQARAHLKRPGLWSRLADVFRWQPARVLVPLTVAALLAVAIILPGDSGSPFPGLAVTDAPGYSVIPVRAGQQDAWLADWESGMESYQDADYVEAAERLQRVTPALVVAAEANPERVHLRDQARFYLGISQMLSDKADQAIASLTEASGSPLPPLRQKSLYHLAQAHLLMEDADSALAALENLVDSPVYGPRARTQIQEIKAAR